MTHDPQTEPQEGAPRLASRRNVLKTAWSVPVIVALGTNPIAAYAQSGRGSGSASFSQGGSAAQISDDRGPQGNNGFGNGDQDAPGGSGPNNGAENDQNGKGNHGGGNGNGGGNNGNGGGRGNR